MLVFLQKGSHPAFTPFQNWLAVFVKANSLEHICEQWICVVVINALMNAAAFLAIARSDGDGFSQIDEVEKLHCAHELMLESLYDIPGVIKVEPIGQN